MTFEEFLIKKRIDKTAFQAADPARFEEWQHLFDQMHPNSFLIQVKMIINDIRLRYHLAEVPAAAVTEKPARPAAARRAAPAARPATSEQKTEETGTEKPAAPSRPVVRRPARPATLAKKTEETEQEQTHPEAADQDVVKLPSLVGNEPKAAETEENAEKPAPRKRPVIKRTTSFNKEEKTETSAENSDQAEKPAARPRPVIKRPAALNKKPTEESESKETTPESSSEVKPAARPRPVIKRPAALSKKAEEDEIKPENFAEDQEPKPEAENVTENKKPARPRPVIKRPVIKKEDASEEQKPSAGETKTPDPDIGRKPPRPRPVIRRPQKPGPFDTNPPSEKPE